MSTSHNGTPVRKTIRVEDLRDSINRRLAASAPEMREARRAMAGILEEVLMATGNYRGYRYTDVTRDEAGQITDFGDTSRREYYASHETTRGQPVR